MNWKECERKRSWANLKFCRGIFLEGLKKTTKNLNQGSRSPSRDLNPEPSEYEAGEPTTRLLRSVFPYKQHSPHGGKCHTVSFIEENIDILFPCT
jgi:hypothetical protein